MENLKSFELWLKNNQFSSSTIRNYLADVNKFLESKLDLTSYLTALESDPNYSRYASSLKKYTEYHQDQNKEPTLTEQIFNFKNYLEKRDTPTSTIKNYINDLVQYVNWLESQNLDPQRTN